MKTTKVPTTSHTTASQMNRGAWTTPKGAYGAKSTLNVTVLFPLGESISSMSGCKIAWQHRSKMIYKGH
jgi:hypothetical protein